MSRSVWRVRLGLWLPALLFFLLNIGAYVVYSISYADETAGLEGRIEAREGELAAVSSRRAEVEQLVTQARTNQEQIQELYTERFSTRRERLTQIIAEVNELAAQAGLDPQVVSYPEEEIEGYNLVERQFVFSVEGTYPQLRRFVNFLELSPSFIALRRVVLAGAAGDAAGLLRINLTLSTLFVEEGALPVVALEGASS